MLERIHKFGCCGTAMLEMARNLRSITSQLYEDRVTSMSFSVKFITMGDQEFAINQLKEERQGTQGQGHKTELNSNVSQQRKNYNKITWFPNVAKFFPNLDLKIEERRGSGDYSIRLLPPSRFGKHCDHTKGTAHQLNASLVSLGFTENAMLSVLTISYLYSIWETNRNTCHPSVYVIS
ncbi:hypothetical protein P5673_008060 [Acropora cervicornis]|uniref:Uncharacterized protein n=1 Tax=Acropora cervicornis TaxID=6130 RepID=A0AAD9QVZ0_ACRCE|nr:hypothetical protein P5673_008060 [Acropora cervicornis]